MYNEGSVYPLQTSNVLPPVRDISSANNSGSELIGEDVYANLLCLLHNGEVLKVNARSYELGISHQTFNYLPFSLSFVHSRVPTILLRRETARRVEQAHQQLHRSGLDRISDPDFGSQISDPDLSN